MKKIFVALLFISLFTLSSSPSTLVSAKTRYPEKILSYHTDIEISKNYSLLITETIKVRSAQIDINRGIIRDLPKSLTDMSGNQHPINPEIVVIFRGDAPDGHHIKDMGKGIRVFVGKTDYILPAGEYTYTIIYKVTNPMVVKEKSFELYWDVTGVRWPFPIENVSATIKLPYGTSERIMHTEGYLGEKLVGEDQIKISRDDFGNINFEVKRPLDLKERFSLMFTWQKRPPPRKKEPPKSLKRLVSFSSNKLKLGDSSDVEGMLTIPLNETLELNFKKREEILEIRKMFVNQHAQLLDIPYLPYSPVWRFISNKKPWWSIKGAYCYGPGEGSIIGESEITRYLTNPFLLLGIDDAFPLPRKKRSFIPVYPRLLSLKWDPLNSTAIATYDMSRYFKERGRMAFDIKNTFYTLINFNARDFGYKYIYSPLEQCIGITPSPDTLMFKKICSLKHTLTASKRCGYPNGCNEVARIQPELDFQISLDSESTLICKLWKKKPINVRQRSDFTFIIKFQ